VGLAFGVASATVSVLAPAIAGGRSAESVTVFDKAMTDETIVERGFTVAPGAAQVDVDVTGPDTESGYPPDFGVRGPAGIRGWTIARRGHVHIDAVSASYGYLPGPIEPGRWHVMLGPRTSRLETLRVTVRVSDRLDSARPVLRNAPGWFAGDLHVHSGHSDGYASDGRGRETPVPLRDLALAAERRGLDFLAVTDHNTISHWVDVDRTQAAAPGLLLLHGREITTPRGHVNALGERRFADFRLGPARPMAALLAEIARDGAFRSINHPWLTSGDWCAGCGWIDRDDATIAGADGVEVLNGSTPSAGGDLPGWRLWADWLNRGWRLTAVGGSDVHDLEHGAAAIGAPSTVVWASELSEDAIVDGLRSGRVFVRVRPDPRLFIELTASTAATTATMGGSIVPGRTTLCARIRGAAGMQCAWMRRGTLLRSSVIHGSDCLRTIVVDTVAGDWFAAIIRSGDAPVMITNPIYVEATWAHASSYVTTR
jgi:hypothetical protein